MGIVLDFVPETFDVDRQCVVVDVLAGSIPDFFQQQMCIRDSNYAGTVAGAIILYILNGLLVNLDMQEGGRNIIYGVIILAVLFLYGRAKKSS